MVKKKPEITTKVTPINKRIVVKRFSAKGVTEGGIIIPDDAKELPIAGRVIAVANGINDIFAGDVVIFGRYSGVEISVDSETLLMVKYDDVLAVYG